MHISTRLILGGSQENTVLSCEGQADRGHEVSLVFGPIYGPEGSLLERVQQHGSIEMIETPDLVRELAPWRDRRCVGHLRDIIRTWKPDVVHTHSSKAGILGRIAAWKERVPCVIHTIHGLAFHPYNSKWRNAIYILSERYAAKRCHRILCVADAMRDQALAAGIGTRELYQTVHSGMDVEPFVNPTWTRAQVRESLGIAPNDFVVGTIARLAELKGHDDLLDGLGTMLKEQPSMKLLWVGDGWFRERLTERIRSMDLEDRIILTGLVPPNEIPRFLQAMDVLCHPSYREGLPRTVTQALLSGTPAVAYDVDGTREVCVTGETGRLVEPGNLDELRSAIAWMQEHPEDRRTMGERGRDRCSVAFSAETMVNALDDVYESVLARHAKRDH